MLINSPLQISLDQQLSFVPAFKDRLLKKLQGYQDEEWAGNPIEALLHHVDPADVDFIVPVI